MTTHDIKYYILYIGPGAKARGPWPRGQDMVYTWRVNFILGLNLWNPRYYKLFTLHICTFAHCHMNEVTRNPQGKSGRAPPSFCVSTSLQTKFGRLALHAIWILNAHAIGSLAAHATGNHFSIPAKPKGFLATTCRHKQPHALWDNVC